MNKKILTLTDYIVMHLPAILPAPGAGTVCVKGGKVDISLVSQPGCSQALDTTKEMFSFVSYITSWLVSLNSYRLRNFSSRLQQRPKLPY